MRFLLFPFACLYGLIVAFRNLFYDIGLFKTYRSKLKTVCIGNLQAGGSGKTPMTAFLFQLFDQQEKIAILSRGYGRHTSGLIEADKFSDAGQIGDEPLWYYQNLKGAKIVVSEKRSLGLQYLENTDTSLVLLDDALQHRAVTCGLNILLTEYRKPFYKDYLLPMGRLREFRSGKNRAQLIIVTKCPPDITEDEMQEISAKIKGKQLVLFSTLKYGEPYSLKGHKKIEHQVSKILALSGLANPADFIDRCRGFGKVEPVTFRDHHRYSRQDLEKINSRLGENDIVICTEKDSVKLMDSKLEDLVTTKYYALPVKPEIIGMEEQEFKRLIESFIN